MTPDAELLRHYAQTHAEADFAELVSRHVNLVYSAALRQVNGDVQLAQDAAQTVFTDLARKAEALAHRDSLTGWLYTSAHFAAAKIVRTETRRRQREETFMRAPLASAPEPDWEALQPVLDAAMHELKDADREAILLRYFENQPFAAVGVKLGLGENAARMRVERALEKLRGSLAQRGITATATLASVLSAHAVQVAPAGLATTLTGAALLSAGTGTFTLFKIMTATQIKLGFGALVVAGATTAFVVQHQAQAKLRADNAALTQQLGQLLTDNESLSNRLATMPQPSFPNDKLNELMKLRGEVSRLRQQASRQTGPKDQAVQAAPTTAAASAADLEKQATMKKMDNAKTGLLAFIMFAGDNHDQYPTNFALASHYLEVESLNQITSNFDIVYSGSAANIANPSATIVLAEKQAWQALNGKWEKVYGFADGHSEVHSEPGGNFDDWESQHIIPTVPNQ